MEKTSQLKETSLTALIDAEKWIQEQMDHLRDPHTGVSEYFAPRYQRLQILQDKLEELIFSKIDSIHEELTGESNF